MRVGDRLDGREPVRRVRIADERDRERAVGIAVDAIGRLAAPQAHETAVADDPLLVRPGVGERRPEVGRQRPRVRDGRRLGCRRRAMPRVAPWRPRKRRRRARRRRRVTGCHGRLAGRPRVGRGPGIGCRDAPRLGGGRRARGSPDRASPGRSRRPRPGQAVVAESDGDRPATAIAVPSAVARTSRGRRAHSRPRRNGSSIRRQLAAATSTDDAAEGQRAGRAGAARRWPATGRTRIGQCHR